VLEAPGAFSQGCDMEEAREMLRDALLLMLETYREETERELEGREGVTRETLNVRNGATCCAT
jgi:predicted RNase H-like HicB family nuclease